MEEINVSPILKLLEFSDLTLWQFSKVSGIPWPTLHRAAKGKRVSLKTAKRVVKHCKDMCLADFGYED